MITEFYSPTHILFGAGALSRVGEMQHLETHALVVTGADTRRAAPLLDLLKKAGVTGSLFAIEKEPTVRVIKEGSAQALRMGAKMVIAFGGGSAIDGGKAIAALMTNPGEPEQYLEVVGEGRPIETAPAPFIAIPTTAGTGAEVTRNAVIKVESHHVKVSMRSPMMLPHTAIVDPLTTCSMPKGVTAACGLDALTQVIEPFVSHLSAPITDALCRDGIRRAAWALKAAFENGDDSNARSDMCLVSLYGGMALANAKLGAVHGFAGPMGGMYDAPHGVICGVLLPQVMAANVSAIRAEKEDDPRLEKFHEVGRILTGDKGATADDAVAWISKLCDDLRLPSLSSFGVRSADVDTIVAKSKQASSMKGNPVALDEGSLRQILLRSLDMD